MTATTEAAARADFSIIRYAQCWEDADVLLAGLDVAPGDVCVSIASAGDNALSLLTRDPARVVALDLNPAQLACVRLRLAAYMNLDHVGLLELIGSRPSERRADLYRRCRPALDEATRTFWDARPADIGCGIGSAGKFERYFRIFRRCVLPLVHSRPRVAQLLAHRPRDERRAFFDQQWNSRRWRLMFKLFFSRWVMGRLGRDAAFFEYVEGSVADRIFQRATHALAELDPSANPYLHWILTGTHGDALPHALREENFELIRSRIGRVELRQASLETFLDQYDGPPISRFNLSDIFEYMSPANYEHLLRQVTLRARPGGRMAYWNMLAPRSRPLALADRLRPLDALSRQLHLDDKAFFYSRFVVEEFA